MKRLAIALATFLGAGYCPFAPGTAGSAAALLLWALLRWAGSPAAEVAVVVILFAAGAWAGTVAESHFGRRDPGQVVLDEVMGMLITLLFAPVTWVGVVIGFFLFRGFDIVKPFPARWCEGLRGGVGIMADDAVAGIYANVALRLVIWLVPALR